MKSSDLRAFPAVILAGALALAAQPSADLIEKGRAALDKQEVVAAWDCARNAVAESPASASAHEFAGEVLFRRGDIHGAEVEFKKALDLAPRTARAWWGMGRVADCASMRKTAAAHFNRAHALDPADPRIFRNWIETLQGRQYIEALRAYLMMDDPGRDEEERIGMTLRAEALSQVGDRKLGRLKSDYAPAEIPFKPLFQNAVALRGFGLPVSINGCKPITLLLDTGAGGITINRKAAAKCGLEKIPGAVFRGIGDDRQMEDGFFAVASTVKVGSVEFSDYPIEVSNRKSVGDEDGLISADVFSDFLVKFDFHNRKLRLDRLPNYTPGDSGPFDRIITTEMRDFTPVYQFAHHLMITTRVNGSRPVLFVIDTGSTATLISSDFAREPTISSFSLRDSPSTTATPLLSI